VGANLEAQEQQTPSTSFYKSKGGRDQDGSSSSPTLKALKDAQQQPPLLGRSSAGQPQGTSISGLQDGEGQQVSEGSQVGAQKPGAANGVHSTVEQQSDSQAAADGQGTFNQVTTGKAGREVGGENRSVTADLTAAAARLSALSRQQQEQEKQMSAAGAVSAALGSTGSNGGRGARAGAGGRTGGTAQQQGQPPQIAGPYCSIQRSPTLRKAFELGSRACLAEGWDVVDVEELELSPTVWAQLAGKQ
jgi:hypothetical protein